MTRCDFGLKFMPQESKRQIWNIQLLTCKLEHDSEAIELSAKEQYSVQHEMGVQPTPLHGGENGPPADFIFQRQHSQIHLGHTFTMQAALLCMLIRVHGT